MQNSQEAKALIEKDIKWLEKLEKQIELKMNWQISGNIKNNKLKDIQKIFNNANPIINTNGYKYLAARGIHANNNSKDIRFAKQYEPETKQEMEALIGFASVSAKVNSIVNANQNSIAKIAQRIFN